MLRCTNDVRSAALVALGFLLGSCGGAGGGTNSTPPGNGEDGALDTGADSGRGDTGGGTESGAARLEGVFPIEDVEAWSEQDLQFQGGASISGGADLTGDGQADIITGAPGIYSDGSHDSGRVYLIPGGSAGATPISIQAEAEFEDEHFGVSLAVVGDLNGDRYEDVLVGGTEYPDGGQAFVFYGPLAASALVEDADLTAFSDDRNHHFGGSVAGPGDLSGDGLPEIAIAGSGATTNYGLWYDNEGEGGVYIFSDFDVGGAITTDDAWSWIDRVDSPVAVLNPSPIDVDGDGVSDLCVAFPNEGSGGAIRIWTAVPGGRLSPDTADLVLSSGVTRAQLGMSMAWADTNGDGHPDLLAGEPDAPDYGERGGPGGAVLIAGPVVNGDVDTVALATFAGEEGGDADIAGFAVALGDLDGDGQLDAGVGAPSNKTLATDLEGRTNGGGGAAYLVYGPLEGGFDLAAAPLRLYGAGSYHGGSNKHYASVGYSLFFPGDLDLDGAPELAVGAPPSADWAYGKGNIHFIEAW